jgi:hypothetical protein
MNKIVLEHYPASKLPDDMRQGFAKDASVTVIIEEERRRPLSRSALLDMMRDAQAHAPGTTLEEAVRRVRTLRDEWED